MHAFQIEDYVKFHLSRKQKTLRKKKGVAVSFFLTREAYNLSLVSEYLYSYDWNVMMTFSNTYYKNMHYATTTSVLFVLFSTLVVLDVTPIYGFTNRFITRHDCSSSSSSSSLKLKMSSSSSYLPFTQVISDVDDTLESSGGVKIGDIALGGIDVQYERGDLYPGVFQFMLELSYHNLPQQQEKIYPPKVAILTARAEEFKLALELKDNSKLAIAFRKTGEQMGFDNWGLGPVLYGSVAEWVIQGTNNTYNNILFYTLFFYLPFSNII